MKKVLFVGYSFNMMQSSGSVRQRGLANYLPQFGWEMVILTPKSNTTKNNNFNVVETKYDEFLSFWKSLILNNKSEGKNKVNKIEATHEAPNKILKNKFVEKTAKFTLDAIYELFAYPDAQKGWYKFAVQKGDEILKSDDFSAIISSSSPVTSHLIAKKLKETHDIPWIADFRDLWTQNPYYNHNKIRKRIESRLEQNTINKADALVTVSKPLAKDLNKLHGKPSYAVYNGFDPHQLNVGASLNNKFTITYTGILYQGVRNPEILFQAINQLIEKNKLDKSDLEINFYGPVEKWLETDIFKYKLDNVVKLKGQVNRETSIEKQRESQILLLLTENNPREKGVVTGKLFDYLAAKRPILYIGVRDGDIEEILNITNAGFGCSNVEDIKYNILKAYNEFKTENNVSYNGIESQINKYNHIEMARKFADVIDSVTK